MARHANAEYAGRHPDQENFTMLQAFEWYCEGGGKHWNLLKEEAPTLASMGITSLWLPPPTKAASKDSVGYNIYDVWDLGEFDQKGSRATHWGTKDELILLIKTARELGMVSYVDGVLNHKMGADRLETFKVTAVDADDRSKDISGLFDIEGWTGFDFPGRKNKYSDFTWNFNHFTGVDYDNKTKQTKIYRIHGEGKNWAEGVDSENGGYDFLMGADVDHSHPDVKKDMLNWGSWIVDEIDAAGFRLDAIKHIDEEFIAEFVKHVRKTSKKPKMFAVGEYWKDSIDDLEGYLERFGCQFSVFDTPLHYNFKQAGEQGNSFDMRTIFDGSVVQKRPIDAVTVVDNHDTQVGQALESWVPAVFKPLAYALTLLRPDGYPCVFWGDLHGTKGPEGNPQPPMTQLEDMIRARKLFAYGELCDYWDHANCVGWVRKGGGSRDGCAVVICNGDAEGVKCMDVGQDHAGERWTDVLGWSQGEVTIGEDGKAEFKCPARSVSIWVHESARGREEFGKK